MGKQSELLLVLIFLLIFILTPINNLFAVPAAPVIYDIEQPDGATFKARQWGDERSHGWETIDGYSIKRDEMSKKWFYAVKNSRGELIVSTLAVGKGKDKRGFKKHLRPSKYLMSQAVGTSGPSAVGPIVMAQTITGTNNIPVILINFSNTNTSYTSSNFENLLFSSENNSMKDYYEEVSYGAFSVSSGPGGIAGWYNASGTHNYYGMDYFGSDRWPGTLVTEAVTAADPSFDFAPYDMDGDCYVDVVDIIHQGTGQEAGGPSTDIWSHRWNLYWAKYFGRGGNGIYMTNDPCPTGGYIMINDYVIQPEILWGSIQTVGVFAHEYGHALGLPDLYDTDNSSEGIGIWGLMASGSWNGIIRSGDRPAHMSAWSKLQLGWITPNIVSGMMIHEPISEASGTSDVYQLLSGDQYFLVENRNKTGFDSGLPRSGLLIWHIDDSKSNNNAECYPPSNCTVNHYKVSLEQADGLLDLEKNSDRGDSGDPFPGVTGNTVFSDSSTPDSNLYNGTLSNVYIADISSPGSIMTATLSVTGDCSDADIDGYGDPGYSQCPNGSDPDCDDNDANNYPSNIEVCDGQDNDCNGLDDVLGFPGSETDNDGDGLSECQSDCDDLDVLEYPGQIWYADGDGDTFGDPLSSNECERLLASDVLDDTDCNDSDMMEFPGQNWWPDHDMDGYATGQIEYDQCSRPFESYTSEELTATSGDCDDNDLNIYPGGPPLRISGTTDYYSTRQDAYDAAINGDIIECQEFEFTDDLNANQNKSVTFDGGYDCGFIPTTNKSTVSANTTISDGVLTLGNIIHN